MNIQEQILYMDIETRTKYSKPDATVDLPLYIGFKDILTNKTIVLDVRKDHDWIQEIIDRYKIIAGHHISGYDIPCLERYGFVFNYKTIVDTYTITEKRAKTMMRIDFAQGERSLDSLCKYFKLKHQKGEYDYNKLQHDLSPEEYEEMKTYLLKDLSSGTDLLLYYYIFFYGFREYMSEKNQNRMSWLTCSSGAVAYKIVCDMTGLPEEYDDGGDDKTGDDDSYSGGYVSLPEVDNIEGDIYIVDYASLYPHIFMMGNLYSPSKIGWSGSGVIPSITVNDADGVQGTYSRTPGVVEQTIQKLYNRRAKLKSEGASGGEEYAIKIVINTMYGITGSSKFVSLYNKTTASDCCAIGRRMNKHAKQVFINNGYKCIYGDTDSVFVEDVHHDRARLEKVIKSIIDIQLKSVNIPISTHSLEIESRVTHMWFFRKDLSEGGGFAKKFYIYKTDDGEIHLKGIRVVRGDCSAFAKHIYKKYIKPKMMLDESPMFSAGVLYNIAKREIVDNIDLLAKRYRVRKFEEYKAPATGIHAQISKRYGAGEHYLVINKKIGAGKQNKYAKREELEKKYGSDWWKQVKINRYVSDLKNFIQPEERKQIDILDRKREVK